MKTPIIPHGHCDKTLRQRQRGSSGHGVLSATWWHARFITWSGDMVTFLRAVHDSRRVTRECHWKSIWLCSLIVEEQKALPCLWCHVVTQDSVTFSCFGRFGWCNRRRLDFRELLWLTYSCSEEIVFFLSWHWRRLLQCDLPRTDDMPVVSVSISFFLDCDFILLIWSFYRKVRTDPTLPCYKIGYLQADFCENPNFITVFIFYAHTPMCTHVHARTPLIESTWFLKTPVSLA